MSVSLKDKIEDLNTKGFAGIVELKPGFVLVQPKGVQMYKILEVKPKKASPKLRGVRKRVNPHWENPNNIDSFFLKKIRKSLRLTASQKIYSRKNILAYSNESDLMINSINNFNLLSENFETKFYKYRRHTKMKLFSNDSGVITTDSDLIFKFETFKSPASEKEFSILFQPSKYLESEKNIWMLVSILGEKYFEKELKNNHLIINSYFIANSFKNSDQYLYHSKINRKIFSSINQRIKSRYKDISKIKLSYALKVLDIPKIENLIEKGEIKY